MRGLLFLLFQCFFSFQATAQEKLFFPVEKADVKRLPQRFEYEMIDKDQFRIGDMLIDADKMQFQISGDLKIGLDVKFRWPAVLLTTGEVILQDNVGKAVWKTDLSFGSLQVSKSKIATHEGETLRTDSALFDAKEFDVEVYQRLRNLPFFRYCVHKEDAKTKIYLCSKSLFFDRKSGPMVISARDSYRPESFVEINGRVVGNQGIIFLQNSADILSMRALMLSGATLDVDTRVTEIDLQDIYKTADNRILIRATGADPAQEEKISSRSGNAWFSFLDLDHPSIYLKGEGGIPLRQDFVLGKNMRPESLVVSVDPDSDHNTYGSTADFYLRASPEIKFSAYDKTSEVRRISSGYWRWRMKKLEVNKSNRRFINVSAPEGNYVGAGDSTRGRRFEVGGLLGMYPLVADLNFQHWMTPHWSWDFNYHSFIQRDINEQSFGIVSLELKYRLKPTLNMIEPSHSLIASFDEFLANQFSINGLSVGGELMFKAPQKYFAFADFAVIKLKVPLYSMNSNFTYGTSFMTEALLRKKNLDWIWDLGVRYENWTFINSPAESDFRRFSGILGLSRLF